MVLIIGVGGFVFWQNKYGTTSTKTADACSNAPVATSSATIVYSDAGYSPTVSSITSGGTVTIKNESNSDIQFDSNPHPIHTDNPELNVGPIASGEEKSIALSKTGCFSFHNHLNPSKTGSILVK